MTKPTAERADAAPLRDAPGQARAFSKSRIWMSSFSSADGSGAALGAAAAAAASDFLRRFIGFTMTRKTAHATIRNWMMAFRNRPRFSVDAPAGVGAARVLYSAP